MKDNNNNNKNRFKKIYTDPKFKPIPKKIKKIELNDKRFSKMFTDKNFISSTEIDEYGRNISNSKKNNDIERYYSIKQNKKEKLNNNNENKNEEEESSSDTSEEFEEFLKENQKEEIEYAKEIEEEENNNYKEIPMGEETKRLAIQNLDWENIHAVDLFIILNSFCTGTQKVTKVEIYPSEFGIKEMEKENLHGPDEKIYNKDYQPKNKKNKNKKEKNTNENENNEEEENSSESINDSENSEGYDPIELRKYELKKLKYYYAVIYCDSIQTASKLYTECDGKEIERTQCFMDMRFIPDSLTKFPFPAKETCDHIPVNKEYVQNFRPNNALQDTKVKLTWDETNKDREDLIERAFRKEGFNEEEINELLVSSDEEDDESVLKNFIGKENDDDDNNGFNLLKKKRKMRQFKDGESFVIKFNKGFEGINNEIKNEEKDKKSKWEKFKENKKNITKLKKMEERKKRKEINLKRKGISNSNELDLLVDKTVKNKEKFKFNPNDERFNTNNNTDFAIDPTNKNYKKVKKNNKI